MNWSFWLGTMSAILNILFIADFFAYAFTGSSLAAVCFTGEHETLSEIILTMYPGMSTAEFIAANGILMGVSVLLVLLSIWFAYASSGIIVDDSSCQVCPRSKSKLSFRRSKQ